MASFRIGTAARLVGVEVATLRNWEQRYGIVVAARSSGRQRLYTSQEIERLRAVKRWIDEGYSAAEAHSLLHDRAAAANPGPTTEAEAWRVRAQARRVRADTAAQHARAAAAQAQVTRHLDALAQRATGEQAARLRQLAEQSRRREQRTKAVAEDAARRQTLNPPTERASS
jgi:DNA-binding transcriptional MerR regulator